MSFLKRPTKDLPTKVKRESAAKPDLAAAFFNYDPPVLGEGEFRTKTEYEVHLIPPLAALSLTPASETATKAGDVGELDFFEEALQSVKNHPNYENLQLIANEFEAFKINFDFYSLEQRIRIYNELVRKWLDIAYE